MINRTRVYKWLFLAAIPLIGMAATGTLLYLMDHAFSHLHAQTSLIHVDEEAGKLHALEGGSISERRFERGDLEDAETLKDEMTGNINESLEMHLGEDLSVELSRSLDLYLNASNDMFRLLAEGRFDDAGRVFKQECEPRFDELAADIHEAVEHHQEYANRQVNYAYFGSLATTVAAVALIILLFSRFEHQRRVAEITQAEKKTLEESEERFRSVTGSANDAIISIDSRDLITFWNPAAASTFGFSTAEAQGQPVSLIMPERFREAHREGLRRVVETEETKIIGGTIEVIGLRRDGSEFPLEMSLSKWDSREGTFFTAIMRDITERKQAEEKIEEQRTKLVARNQELSVLFDVSFTIGSSLGMDKLLDQTLETILKWEISGIQQGGIFIVEDDRLVLAADRGLSRDFIEAHRELRVGECLCGRAVETGEAIVLPNAHEDSRHTISYPGMEPHGDIIIPLKAVNKVVGVLYLSLQAGAEISERERMLLASIGGQIGIAMENANLYEETKKLSLHDPLTGLANRNLMNLELPGNMARASRSGKPFALIMLDLDHFKQYNDTYGHSAGDNLLVEVARIAKRNSRETDLVVRFGGEEFLIVLPETGSSTATAIAERLRKEVMETDFYPEEGKPAAHITVSLGVAAWRQDIADVDELIKLSDEALYRAKEGGRNRVESQEK